MTLKEYLESYDEPLNEGFLDKIKNIFKKKPELIETPKKVIIKKKTKTETEAPKKKIILKKKSDDKKTISPIKVKIYKINKMIEEITKKRLELIDLYKENPSEYIKEKSKYLANKMNFLKNEKRKYEAILKNSELN